MLERVQQRSIQRSQSFLRFLCGLGVLCVKVLDSDLKMLAGGKTVQEVLEAYPEIELVRRSTPVTGQGVWAPCGW